MTTKILIVLWLVAAVIFVLAAAYLPRRWEYSWEGSYLYINLIWFWALILLVLMGVLTIWWRRSRG